jgi:uncharacterized protein YjbI with pentapeptide repeats
MANPEHVEILELGFRIWNPWRKDNPDITPDLSNASFIKANLVSIDLSNSDLKGANLTEAFLGKANLRGSKLDGVKLIKAHMYEANLFGANLSRANLSEANLGAANFSSANLKEAILEGADLRAATLHYTDLSKAIIHKALLWGSARDGWKINGAQCSYIYDDVRGENRVPKDRDFEEGEFESLYSSLPSFEYVFENGMQPLDPIFMNQIAENIKAKNPEFDLKIDSMNARGIQPTIKFTVKHEHKESAELAVREDYEKVIERLKGREEAFKEMLQSYMGNNPVQITGGNFPGANFGSNQGTQTWNLTQIDNSTKLDEDTKAWLKSVAGQLQNANLDETDQTFAQAKLEAFQSEIENDQKDESKIQKTWKTLVGLAPDIQKLSTLPDSLNKIIGPLLGG